MKKIPIIVGAVVLLAAAALVGCNLFAGAMSVSWSGSNIAFGSTVTVNTTSPSFIITNTGSNTLNITGNVTATSFTGGLTVSSITQPASSVAINQTTTFVVNLSGSGTALISIPNDSGQNPFTFTLKH